MAVTYPRTNVTKEHFSTFQIPRASEAGSCHTGQVREIFRRTKGEGTEYTHRCCVGVR